MSVKGTYSPIVDISEKNSYLVPNQDLRGNGPPYVKASGYLDASMLVDPASLVQNGTTVSLTAIPSPIKGKYIQLPDGNVTAPALSWQGEVTSGRYRIGTANAAESILGTLVYDWNASRIKYATSYKIYMGTSSNIYGGAAGTDDYIATLDTVNAGVRITLKNASSGNSAYSAVSAMNDQSNAVSAGIIGSGYTIPNLHAAGEGFLVMSDGGGLGGTLKGLLIANRLNSYLRFGTNDTDRGRILAAGQWIINATTLVGTEQLRVNGSIYCDGSLTVIGTISAASTSAATVTATSSFQAANGTAIAPSYTFTTQTSFGFYKVGSLILGVGNGTVAPLAFNAATGSENLAISSSGTFSWSAGTNAATTGADLFLARDGAGILAQKNLTNAQTFRVYGNATGSKYLSMAHDGTNASITTSSGNLTIAPSGAATTITGTLTLSTMTSGSVLFAGTSGIVSQSNASLFWDDSAKQLQVTGTANPQIKLFYDGSNTVTLQSSSAGNLEIVTTGFNVNLRGNRSGDNVYFGCLNSNNASGVSGAAFFVSSGGSSAGDAYMYYEILGVTPWCAGIDNSDSDSWKLSQGSTLGSGDKFTITTAGNVTIAGTISAGTSIVANGTNAGVFAYGADATSPQFGLKNASGTLHWEFYETLGAAGQQGDIHLYDGVAATDRMKVTTNGYLTFPVVRLGFFAATAAVQQTSGANLTNNVTSGGTDDTIADFTSLTIYATDAAAIRNDIYQLARKLKQVNDSLRTYGLLT